MNLQPLFEAQKKLDDHIEKSKGLQDKNLLSEKILALQVELGELANEWRGFKYWSEDQFPREHELTLDKEGALTTKRPLLEEYADGLHFILSIGNDLKIKVSKPTKLMQLAPDIKGQFNALFQLIAMLDPVTLLIDENAYRVLLNNYFNLGESLGFTPEQIEQAYFAKNEENHRRQENGY